MKELCRQIEAKTEANDEFNVFELLSKEINKLQLANNCGGNLKRKK